MPTRQGRRSRTLCTGPKLTATFVGADAMSDGNIAIAKGFNGISITDKVFATGAKAEGNETNALRFNDEKENRVSYGSICVSTYNTAEGAINGPKKASEANGAGHCA